MIGPGDEMFSAPFFCNAIVGKNLFQFISGLDVTYFYQALTARILKTGRTVNFAYRCDGPWIRRDMRMQISSDAELVRYESAVVRETLRERKIPTETPDAATLVAICSFCKSYRYPIASTDWKELEELLTENDLPVTFRFTHSVCDDCYARVIRELDE
jgi:hypothetical protein